MTTPLLLIILDGWGHSEETEHNAIAKAHTPFWDELIKTSAHTLLDASGEVVGLPKGQMGNSEVGHMHLGAGRLIYQDLTRIDNAIESGDFFNNKTLQQSVATLKESQRALHLIGLLSPGGVHAHERHFFAAIKMAEQSGLNKVYIHAFLDGRDTPPQSAEHALEKLTAAIREAGVGELVSVVGRYYAMDRDRRWERTEKAYNLLTQGQYDRAAKNYQQALELARNADETDEFVAPTSLGSQPFTIEEGDAVWFLNFRSDRARQLSHAFCDQNFAGFKRGQHPKLSHFVTMTEYAKDLNTEVAFKKEGLSNIFGELIANAKLSQLRIAETEKYAHVTFFFNGGREEPFPMEERILIPSPKVATYDMQPQMHALKLTEALVNAIYDHKFSAIISNFANPDMVGHTGNFHATVKAIETIDECLHDIVKAARAVGMEVLITADHGNAEKMYDNNTQQPHTAHTNELVPIIYSGRAAKPMKKIGCLSDVAPTMLYLMGLDQPAEMTGTPIFKLN